LLCIIVFVYIFTYASFCVNIKRRSFVLKEAVQRIRLWVMSIVCWLKIFFNRWNIYSMKEWMLMCLHGAQNQKAWPRSTLLLRVVTLRLWMNCLLVVLILMLEPWVPVVVSIFNSWKRVFKHLTPSLSSFVSLLNLYSVTVVADTYFITFHRDTTSPCCKGKEERSSQISNRERCILARWYEW